MMRFILFLVVALVPLASGCSLVASSTEPLSGVCEPACASGVPCVGGRCVTEVRQETTDFCVEGSVDSACPDDMRCVFGRCEPAQRCVEEDCPAGYSCGADGFCREVQACQGDNECDDGLFCSGVERCDALTGECAIGTPPCTAEAPYCSEETQACLECQGDEQCNNGNFCDGQEVCAFGFCTTSDEPACEFGCDAALNRCRSCNVDTDCTEDVCLTGVIECDDGACNVAQERCAANEICIPEPDGGLRCVECVNNDDCDNRLRCDGIEECVDNVCVTDENSLELCDDDDEPNCIEDPSDNDGFDCVACVEDIDCNDGRFCNGTEYCDDGRCRYEFGERNPDSDLICTSPGLSACNEEDDTCYFCVEDDDCGDGDQCTADSCIDFERCESVPRCPGQECAQGICGECSANSQCDDGRYCNGEERCVVEGVPFVFLYTRCVSGDAPCDGNEPYCNENTERCDECQIQAHCLDADQCNGIESCSDGECQSGVERQCAGDETCEPATGDCVANP